jgi:thiamine-monophosphate kinase
MAEASSVAIDFDHLVLGGFAAELSRAFGVELEVSRRAVMHGGEDHCLLACFPPGDLLPAGFVKVGKVIQGRTALDRVMLRGESIEPIGWNPYAQ